MENMLRPNPFGLVGAGSAYQNAINHLFIDHTESNRVNDLYKMDLPKADQPTPVVNMVATSQVPDDSLHNILDETPDAYSEGSTETVDSGARSFI
jgi:hypothetical protein